MKLFDNKYFTVKAYGKCMEPSINEGNMLLVTKVCKESDIEIGDVIICKIPSGLGCHRVINIIKTNNYLFITKGDTRLCEDEPLKFENMVGKVILNLSTQEKFV